MARACLAAVLAFGAMQDASANFMSSMMKSMVCDQVTIPFVCSSSSSKDRSSASSSSTSGSSGCSGDSCCSDSSCSSVPGMGCDSSRGSVLCVGSSFPFTQGQCQCKDGGACSSGVCSGGSSGSSSPFSGLFEEKEVVRVPREDHSRALALYTGGACLLVVASLSAGVRQLRRQSSRQLAGDDEQQRPTWELLEQASSSGE